MQSRIKPSTPRLKSASVLDQQRLLDCIRRLHVQYKRGDDTETLFAMFLDDILKLSNSPYGATWEVSVGGRGKAHFQPRASVYSKEVDLQKIDALLKQIISTGRMRIVAKPAAGNRRRNTEQNFPETFLGLPIFSGKTVVGAVGVANRPAGYDKEFAQFLVPLFDSFSALLHVHRVEQQRKATEKALRQEISGRKRIETILREIAKAVSASTGVEYFRSLVKQLSKALHVDTAFISIPAGDAPGTAKGIAFCDRDVLRDVGRYALPATPCQKVLKRGAQFYPSGLQKTFPRSAIVKEYGWESYLGVPLHDVSGDTLGLLAVADRKPMTQRQPFEAILQICAARISAELMHQRAEEKMYKLSQALEQTADSITITDDDGVIEYINPSFTVMTGFSAREALGRNHNIVKSGRHDAQFYRQLWDTLKKGQAFRDVFINRKKSGELYYEEKTITPLKDARDHITHYISTGKDITERMQTQERLHYLAYHDVLTELPNRSLFLEWLNHALVTNNGARLAVICIDIDRFKIINDTLGHAIGDRLLLLLARLLKGCLNKGDTVARLGGDEFGVLVEHIASPADVISRISKMLEALAQPLRIDEHELYTTISIGVALAPDDGTDANTLLKNADAALYRAKEQGRHTYQFYSADLSDRASKQLGLETSLYRALEREEFYLCYQTQVDIETGQVVGLEALLRWQHPELGTVDPLEFIPLLEDTGLIIPVGEWVLRAACKEAGHWQGLGSAPLRLSVNLSGRQFIDPDLHKTVDRILAETDFPPQLLEMEITESVLMQNDQASTSNLDAFQHLGVRLAIDDFGTGYSSLSYLKRFPVDTLKIDRSFIHDVIHNRNDKSIIKAIIAMARSLQVDIIAEGVETLEQLRFLRGSGCHTAQGFLLSKPFTADELPHFLQHSVHFV